MARFDRHTAKCNKTVFHYFSKQAFYFQTYNNNNNNNYNNNNNNNNNYNYNYNKKFLLHRYRYL